MTSQRFTAVAGVLLLCVLLAAAVAAQQPRIINGRLTPQAAGASLQRTFDGLVAAQTDPAWIGYVVPVRTRSTGNCWTDGAPQGPIKLEGSGHVVVLFRIEARRLERIRVFPDDCELDAGGLPLHWIQDVRPADSVALLAALVEAEAGQKSRITNSALMAISQHADPAAATTVTRLARGHAVPGVRGEAIFWLAQMAGNTIAGTITEAIEKDPDTEVKRRAVFALGQLPKDEGVPLLINVARTHANPAVRKQAMFWLGQSKDPRAIAFFAEILK